MAFTYRKLQAHESKTYRAIRLEALKNHGENFGSTYETENAKPKLAFEEIIEKQQADRFMMGAFDNGLLIGICGFYQEAPGKFRHKGTIIQVYVKPGYKGQKIGLHLLKAAIEEAFNYPETEQILLGVVAGNLAATRIYEQAGFKEYGYHKDFTKDGDKYSDERLMILYRTDYRASLQ